MFLAKSGVDFCFGEIVFVSGGVSVVNRLDEVIVW